MINTQTQNSLAMQDRLSTLYKQMHRLSIQSLRTDRILDMYVALDGIDPGLPPRLGHSRHPTPGRLQDPRHSHQKGRQVYVHETHLATEKVRPSLVGRLHERRDVALKLLYRRALCGFSYSGEQRVKRRYYLVVDEIDPQTTVRFALRICWV